MLTEHLAAEPHISSLLLRLPPRVTARLPQNGSLSEIQSGGAISTTTTTPGGTVNITTNGIVRTEKQELEEQANGLLAELKVWDNACNFTPFHPRTQYGNIAYRHATKIRLLRVVFGVSSTDPRIESASRAIIELAKEMLAMYGRIVWLTWPLVIAGFHIPKGDPMRLSAVELLSEFG